MSHDYNAASGGTGPIYGQQPTDATTGGDLKKDAVEPGKLKGVSEQAIHGGTNHQSLVPGSVSDRHSATEQPPEGKGAVRAGNIAERTGVKPPQTQTHKERAAGLLERMEISHDYSSGRPPHISDSKAQKFQLTSAEVNVLKNPQIVDALGSKGVALLESIAEKLPRPGGDAGTQSSSMENRYQGMPEVPADHAPAAPTTETPAPLPKFGPPPSDPVARQQQIIKHMKAVAKQNPELRNLNGERLQDLSEKELISSFHDGSSSSMSRGVLDSGPQLLLNRPESMAKTMPDRVIPMFEKIEQQIGMERDAKAPSDTGRARSTRQAPKPLPTSPAASSSRSTWTRAPNIPSSSRPSPFLRRQRTGTPSMGSRSSGVDLSREASSSSAAPQSSLGRISGNIDQFIARAKSEGSGPEKARIIKDGIASLGSSIATEGLDAREVQAQVLGSIMDSGILTTIPPEFHTDIMATAAHLGARATAEAQGKITDRAVQKATDELGRKVSKHEGNPKKAAARFSEGLSDLAKALGRLDPATKQTNAAAVKAEATRVLNDAKLPPAVKAELREQIDRLAGDRVTSEMSPQDAVKVTQSAISSEMKYTQEKRAKIEHIRSQAMELRREIRSLKDQKSTFITDQKGMEDAIEKLNELSTLTEQLEAFERDGTVPDDIDKNDQEAVNEWSAQVKRDVVRLTSQKESLEKTRDLHITNYGKGSLEEARRVLNSNIGGLDDQIGKLEAQVKSISSEIADIIGEMHDSTTRLAKLTGSLNEYLRIKDPNGDQTAYEPVFSAMCQSYTSVVALANGHTPPDLDNREYELFAVLHSRSSALQENLDWDAYENPHVPNDPKDEKGADGQKTGKTIPGLKTAPEYGFKNAATFNNEAGLQIANDIIHNSRSRKEVFAKIEQYNRVGSALYQVGSIEAAVAVTAGLSLSPVARLAQRDYLPRKDTPISGDLLKVRNGGNSYSNYREPFAQGIEEGGTPLTYIGYLLSDRTFNDEGGGDPARLRALSESPKRVQSRIRSITGSTGQIEPRASSPLSPTSPLADDKTLNDKSNEMFPRQT